jgi:hypothetical protein
VEGLIDGQGLGLPARTVQRQHELVGERFPVWVLGGQPGELCDQLGVLAQLKFRLVPLLQRRQAQVVEASGLDGGDRGYGSTGQGRAPPQGERRLQEGGRAARLAGRDRLPGLTHQRLEAVQVELARLDGELVAGRASLADLAPDRPAEPPDQRMQGVPGRNGPRIVPELADEPVAGHHLVGPRHQGHQQRLLHRREAGRPAVHADLERSEDGDLQTLHAGDPNSSIPPKVTQPDIPRAGRAGPLVP